MMRPVRTMLLSPAVLTMLLLVSVRLDIRGSDKDGDRVLKSVFKGCDLQALAPWRSCQLRTLEGQNFALGDRPREGERSFDYIGTFWLLLEGKISDEERKLEWLASDMSWVIARKSASSTPPKIE